MSKRIVHALLALGLVLGLFAGTLVSGSASEHDVPNQMYFPWVPNGADIDDPRDFGETGPYYGTVTIQNLEGESIDVYYRPTNGGGLSDLNSYSGPATLDAYASMTFSADDLGVPDTGAQGSGVAFAARIEGSTSDPARIAGVQKQASPTEPGEDDATTGTSHDTVAGYTGLSENEVAQDVVLPIVQTNNNWNTLIRLTNLGDSAATIDLTLYEAGGDDPPITEEDLTVAAGNTLTYDLVDEGVPDGWVGSAHISADRNIVAAAERVKNETNMLIMNTAQLATDGDTQYGPLVFREYFHWNTGISIANLADQENVVTIRYYSNDGTHEETTNVTVPANGMNFVYTPVLPGEDGDGFVGSAVITGEHEFRGAVDEVKYFGADPDTGHAMSYMIEDQAIGMDESLALPLVQKGDADTASGDTSGIQLFNPDSDDSATAAIWFFDQAGNQALAIPQVVHLDPHEGHTAYAYDIDELPIDFQGSAIIRVIEGDGPVTAVSNNVNYDVEFDGSASFNLIDTGNVGPESPEPLPDPLPDDFTVDPLEATNEVETEHSITVTVEDDQGDGVEGATVAGVIISGPNDDTAISSVQTDSEGEATLTYTGGMNEGTDQILIHVQGISETQIVTKTWEATN